MILVDQRINLIKAAKELGGGMQVFMRKRRVPFPVKVSGQDFTQKQLESSIKHSVEECTHLLISGGREFTFGCSKTESFSTKEGVKNTLHAIYQSICILIFCQNTNQQENKHNRVETITLSTSKSIPISIYAEEAAEEIIA